MAEAPRHEKARKALRFNAFVAASLGFTASLLLFLGKLPFPNEVAWFSLFSSLCYAAYFLFFDWICRHHYRAAGVGLSQIGSVIISISIYFSGGVVSPLPFLYMAILVSEAIYGLENPFTVPVSAAGYLAAVWGIYFGFFPNPAPWAAAAYAHPAFLFIISVLLVSYLALTKNLSDQIIRNLHSELDRESADKAAMLKRFSELDSSAQIGSLAHRIAHDLRAPLSSISGYVQMALIKAGPSADTRELKDLDEVVDRMTESLTCITRFGKRAAAAEEEISLPDLFRQLLAIAAFSPQARGVKFSAEYPSGPGPAVRASRSDLQQAYFNIVKNALEAMADNSDGRKLAVTVRVSGRDAEVLLADNGPGMPPDLLRNVFRRSLTTKKDGTGVGLMIARDLLAKNGGDIEFRNRPEGGLEVLTRLPLAGEAVRI